MDLKIYFPGLTNPYLGIVKYNSITFYADKMTTKDLINFIWKYMHYPESKTPLPVIKPSLKKYAIYIYNYLDLLSERLGDLIILKHFRKLFRVLIFLSIIFIPIILTFIRDYKNSRNERKIN